MFEIKLIKTTLRGKTVLANALMRTRLNNLFGKQ
jgi:hypothetical protein